MVARCESTRGALFRGPFGCFFSEATRKDLYTGSVPRLGLGHLVNGMAYSDHCTDLGNLGSLIQYGLRSNLLWFFQSFSREAREEGEICCPPEGCLDVLRLAKLSQRDL